MPLPNLIHPIPTEVQTKLSGDTLQDEGYREPVQTIGRSETFTVPGQWLWFTDKDLRATKHGAEEGSNGYVLFRTIDLYNLGKKIDRGDRIIGYGAGPGRVDLDVEIVRLQYQGHYSDQAGPSLVRAFFADRQPARQSRGG